MRWTLLRFERKSGISVMNEKNIGPATLFFNILLFAKPPALDKSKTFGLSNIGLGTQTIGLSKQTKKLSGVKHFTYYLKAQLLY
jgi:hypothetical protein